MDRNLPVYAGNEDLIPAATAAAAKSLQSCPTLCDPRDSSPRGSPIPGILQACFECLISCIKRGLVNDLILIVLSCSVGQAPLSIEFSRQEYWSRLPFRTPGTMEYYSAIKRNIFEPVILGWMNLEPIIQSEVSQKGKSK